MTVDPNNPSPAPEKNPATGPESRRVLFIAIAVAIVLIGIIWWVSQRKDAPATAGSTATATSTANDPVIFEVNGEAVRQSEFTVAAQALPENMRGMLGNEPAKKALAEEIIRMKVLAQEAEKLNIDDRPEIAGRIAMERTNVLARAALMEMLQKLGPQEPRQLYEQTKSRWEYVEADQILIAYAGSAVQPKSGKPLSREEARAKTEGIANRIRGGADFAALVKEESDDTEGAARGGSIGRVGKGMSPEQIDAALFALQPGQTSGVVESPYGFHIFRVTSRGLRPYEELEPLLRERGQAIQADVVLEDLRKTAKVEYKPAFDSFTPPAESPAMGQPAPQQVPPQQ
jgi:peptidyl-prolyl cis-trans isomerase C